MGNWICCLRHASLWNNSRFNLKIKMKTGTSLEIFSQIINFVIFVYFTITLIKINALDVIGLLISAFGLLASLIASIVSALEEKK
jgi:predicted neutral ceramidase superfamily lipid hydrolase